jgi:hypothetical protein
VMEVVTAGGGRWLRRKEKKMKGKVAWSGEERER